MKPIVNLQETPGKIVGRIDWGPKNYDQMVRSARALMPRLPYPKGVYRFHSFEEADKWMEKHTLEAAIRKRRARQNEKI